VTGLSSRQCEATDQIKAIDPRIQHLLTVFRVTYTREGSEFLDNQALPAVKLDAGCLLLRALDRGWGGYLKQQKC
jgi:hypothetical protein